MKKVLVTGASGNVGKFVAQELLKMGETIVCAGTSLERLRKIYAGKAECRYHDLTIIESFDAALEGVDRVFLMRPPQLGNPGDLYAFIDRMKARNIELVSFLSLMGAENNPIPPHHKIEKTIEAAGIPYAHIRPGFFMQNLSGIHAEEIRHRDEILVPAGRSKTSFIDAADIGLAAALLLHQPAQYKNTAHTLTGPEALDYYQIADILSEVTGRRIRYSKPGFYRYRNYYIKTRGFDKAYVNVTVALYLMTRMGTAKKVSDGFYRLTGKQPRPFISFARENSAAFMPRGTQGT